MRKPLTVLTTLLLLILMLPQAVAAADAKVVSLTCVGLMSETGDGNISWRSGKADWTVVKLGDVIPLAAELKISVDRDWIELTPTNDPSKVYDLEGTEKEQAVCIFTLRD